MGKIIKEITIGILLAIVIIILLIIALYEYMPAQKTVSSVETYQRTGQTSNVLQEIATSSLAGKNNESIIKSYSISSSDLSIYGKTGSYDKGRGDPFADVNELESNTTGGNSVNTTNSTNTTTTPGNNTNTSTGYFNSTGKTK